MTPPNPTILAAGIYGFSFTRPIDLGRDVALHPLYNDHREVSQLAQARDVFHLTGWATIPMMPGVWHKELPQRLEASLTFAAQRPVLAPVTVSAPESGATSEWVTTLFTGTIEAGFARKSPGPIVIDDHVSPGSLGDLVSTLMRSLSDSGMTARGFDAALHRVYEAFFLRKPLLEIRYFLAFSALEILARRAFRRPKPLESKIVRFGESIGLHLEMDDVKPWVKCRDAIFHNGELRQDGHQAGQSLRPLEHYLTYALVRMAGFDDGHVNWNAWRDLQPFV
jgi:hypothetical protein